MEDRGISSTGGEAPRRAFIDSETTTPAKREQITM